MSHFASVRASTQPSIAANAFNRRGISRLVRRWILGTMLGVCCQFSLPFPANAFGQASPASKSTVTYESTEWVVPILNDGSKIDLLEFTLDVTKLTSLSAITLSTEFTTDTADLAEVAIRLKQESGDKEFGKLAYSKSSVAGKSIELKGDQTLPPGKHRFRLSIRSRKDAKLLNAMVVRITGLEFQNVDQLAIPASTFTVQHLAYPIHQRHQFDCHTFRIPGIAKANNGNLLAVYDMRYDSSRDLQGDMDIGLSRSSDGGQTWSEPAPIMDMGEFQGKSESENGCSDPCILVDSTTGEIFVAACWTYGKPNTHQWSGKGSEPGLDILHSTQFMVVRSTDHGKTWSQPENWTDKLKDPKWHLFAPAPGNGITMSDGRLVMPTQGRDAEGLPFSNVTWSDDHGKTWHVSQPARRDTTECAVVELSDGRLMLNMRDNRNRKLKDQTNGRAVATTKDLGQTWTRHDSDHALLPEPTCMASLIRLDYEGRPILLFSNPNNKSRRAGMTLQISFDDGKSWPVSKRLLLDTKGGAYSSLVMIDEKTIGILYESSVADMVFQKIPIDWSMGR
ncbi:MAG: sialidase-1 [Mariniblastus sp.]|jgi:sialidase-1